MAGHRIFTTWFQCLICKSKSGIRVYPTQVELDAHKLNSHGHGVETKVRSTLSISTPPASGNLVTPKRSRGRPRKNPVQSLPKSEHSEPEIPVDEAKHSANDLHLSIPGIPNPILETEEQPESTVREDVKENDLNTVAPEEIKLKTDAEADPSLASNPVPPADDVRKNDEWVESDHENMEATPLEVKPPECAPEPIVEQSDEKIADLVSETSEAVESQSQPQLIVDHGNVEQEQSQQSEETEELATTETQLAQVQLPQAFEVLEYHKDLIEVEPQPQKQWVYRPGVSLIELADIEETESGETAAEIDNKQPQSDYAEVDEEEGNDYDMGFLPPDFQLRSLLDLHYQGKMDGSETQPSEIQSESESDVEDQSESDVENEDEEQEEPENLKITKEEREYDLDRQQPRPSANTASPRNTDLEITEPKIGPTGPGPDLTDADSQATVVVAITGRERSWRRQKKSKATGRQGVSPILTAREAELTEQVMQLIPSISPSSSPASFAYSDEENIEEPPISTRLPAPSPTTVPKKRRSSLPLSLPVKQKNIKIKNKILERKQQKLDNKLESVKVPPTSDMPSDYASDDGYEDNFDKNGTEFPTSTTSSASSSPIKLKDVKVDIKRLEDQLPSSALQTLRSKAIGRRQEEKVQFKCTMCDRSFLTQKSLRLHISHHRRKTDNKVGRAGAPASREKGKRQAYPCEICSELFTSQTARNFHMSQSHASPPSNFHARKSLPIANFNAPTKPPVSIPRLPPASLPPTQSTRLPRLPSMPQLSFSTPTFLFTAESPPPSSTTSRVVSGNSLSYGTGGMSYQCNYCPAETDVYFEIISHINENHLEEGKPSQPNYTYIQRPKTSKKQETTRKSGSYPMYGNPMSGQIGRETPTKRKLETKMTTTNTTAGRNQTQMPSSHPRARLPPLTPASSSFSAPPPPKRQRQYLAQILPAPAPVAVTRPIPSSHMQKNAAPRSSPSLFPVSSIKKTAYECSECGLCLANNDSLKRHYLTHTGGKPYQCRFCALRIAHFTGVTRHVNKFHPNELAMLGPNVKPYIR